MKKTIQKVICCMMLLLLCACAEKNTEAATEQWNYAVPEKITEPVIEDHGNVPYFEENEKVAICFESYSPLDELGRCGAAYACVGPETLPDAEREDISSITPSGWINHTYFFVEQEYLYNRCHLIGYQLTAENLNERNLITGTRYMNIKGMLPLENQVGNYVRDTGNHVLYRVTPIFEGKNLVANGVLMEAWSVEDGGKGVSFCMFAYNVQPGVRIDYATGENEQELRYIGSQILKIYHKDDCPMVKITLIKTGFNSSDEAKKAGFSACKHCKP